MRSHSRRWNRQTCCALMVLVGACTQPAGQKTTRTQPRPYPPTITSDSTTHASRTSEESIHFRIAPGVRRYIVINDASVTLNDDTAKQSLISTRAYYTLEIDQSGQVQQGRVDSLTTRRQGAIPPPSDSTLTFPITWTASQNAQGCSQDKRLVDQGRSIIPRLPLELRSGLIWHDTTSTRLCILNSSVSATTISEYTAVGRSTFRADSTYLIRRISHLELLTDTANTLSQRPSIQATGFIRSELHIDPSKGRLVARTDEGRLEIRVTNGLQFTKFTQDLRGQVAPLN